MFGCCVAGRLLQTNMQQIDETHAAFELPNASSINHICVFLLGTIPFPADYGATVHLQIPGKGFQLLGMLSNEKPSAIFRLRGTFNSASTYQSYNEGMPMNSDDSAAVLGIAVEPLQLIEAQMSSLSLTVAKTAPDEKNPIILAEKVVKNLFNYISGFMDGGPITPQTLLPMEIIVKWYESFLSKVRNGGLAFLDNQ